MQKASQWLFCRLNELCVLLTSLCLPPAFPSLSCWLVGVGKESLPLSSFSFFLLGHFYSKVEGGGLEGGRKDARERERTSHGSKRKGRRRRREGIQWSSFAHASTYLSPPLPSVLFACNGKNNFRHTKEEIKHASFSYDDFATTFKGHLTRMKYQGSQLYRMCTRSSS